MITINSHCHTIFSDGENTVQQMIDAAKKAGLKILTITDHFEMDGLNNYLQSSNVLTAKKLKNYLDEIENTDKKGIKVLKGLEIEYNPDYEEEIKKLIKELDIDYSLGAVHYLGKISIDSNYKDFEENIRLHKGAKKLVSRYYDTLKKAINSGIFDCIAHLDIIRMLNPNGKYFDEAEGEYKNQVMECLNLIKKKGIAIEINCRGFDKPTGKQYPEEETIKKAVEIGIDICVGSDAHKKEDIIRNFDKVEKILKSIGCKNIVYFEKRKKRYVELK